MEWWWSEQISSWFVQPCISSNDTLLVVDGICVLSYFKHLLRLETMLESEQDVRKHNGSLVWTRIAWFRLEFADLRLNIIKKDMQLKFDTCQLAQKHRIPYTFPKPIWYFIWEAIEKRKKKQFCKSTTQIGTLALLCQIYDLFRTQNSNFRNCDFTCACQYWLVTWEGEREKERYREKRKRERERDAWGAPDLFFYRWVGGKFMNLHDVSLWLAVSMQWRNSPIT